MKTRQLTGGFLAVALTMAPLALAAPKATKWQTFVTSPSGGTGATIKVTKPSKIQAGVSTGNVTFKLKLSGVTDTSDALVTLTGNTFQIDVVVNGIFSTMMFTFDLTDGKVSQKFSVANSSLPSGGVSAGDPIEIRAARVVQAPPNSNVFAVAGITAK